MIEACDRGARWVEIFAVTSSGCIGLSNFIGLPLVCLRVSSDPAATVSEMNATQYGGAALWYDSFQPFECQPGWADWRLFPFDLDPADPALPASVAIRDGRLGLGLPDFVNPTRFAAKLNDALRGLDLATVVTSPTWLYARSREDACLLVPPRYTLADVHDFRVGACKVETLYTLDPTRHGALVARLALRARTATIREAEDMACHVS